MLCKQILGLDQPNGRLHLCEKVLIARRNDKHCASIVALTIVVVSASFESIQKPRVGTPDDARQTLGCQCQMALLPGHGLTCTNASSGHILSGRRAAVDVFAVHTAAYPGDDEFPIEHKPKDKENIEKSEKMMGQSP